MFSLANVLICQNGLKASEAWSPITNEELFRLNLNLKRL